MRIWVNGISGRVGQEIKDLCVQTSAFKLTGGSSSDGLVDDRGSTMERSAPGIAKAVSKADMVLDFSSTEGNQLLLDALLSTATPGSILLGTTGLPPGQKEKWITYANEVAGTKILFAPNTSLGVLATAMAAKQLAKIFAEQGFDIEVSETHHRNKADAPSGTALYFAESIRTVRPELNIKTHRDSKRLEKEIGVSSIRGGGNFGEHEVHFLADHEEVKLSHRALSRALFAKGALVLSQWLAKQKPGIYQLGDVTL